MAALPKNCRPIILADRGFARSEFFEWLNERKLDFVIRIDKGTCVTDVRGTRYKLGADLTLQRGEQLWLGRVRYAIHHGRPSDIWVNFGCSWVTPDSGFTRKKPKEPEHP